MQNQQEENCACPSKQKDEPRISHSALNRRNGFPRQRPMHRRAGRFWRNLSIYSYRSAVMGSTSIAFFAGKEQATAATTPSSVVATSSNIGSRELPSAQRASTLFKASVSTNPTTIPLPTLAAADEKAIFRTCPRRAPRAIRIPNSLVRCATE